MSAQPQSRSQHADLGPPIKPIFGDSIEHVCFSATDEDLRKAAPGWLLPAPNRPTPIRERTVNPFTGEPLLSLNYRAPDQPRRPAHSAWPKLDHLSRVGAPLVDPQHFAALVSAISGADRWDVFSQLNGQELITSGEHEAFMYLIPEPIVSVIRNLKSDQVDRVAQSWAPIQDEDGTIHPAFEERRSVLVALIQLFSQPTPRNTRFLLFWADT